MLALPRTIRIAMLNADTPVPNVAAKRGSYGNIFHDLLVAAASRVAPHITIESEDFDVVRGEYPRSPSDFDNILVTGSASSSYDDNQWIHKLDAYLLDVYQNFPQVRLFGSCFGHQIICQSILRDCGAYVAKNPQGWEIGVHEIKVSPAYRKACYDQPSLRLQFIHSDNVNIPSPENLPSSWITMGSTDECAVQGVYEPGRVLTFQGHFEFDRFINSETLKTFGAKWNAEILQSALDNTDREDDSEVAADMVVRFMVEGRQAVEGIGGLMTPPL
ncbi:unnamed protein product [Clonostachys byssicola]|uniref:Glutamine amidotransferase domain-containing protein n=1 Tax=Clonostachys byssicola TaxID=160290 RepID=A0A9N9UN67_9HYPO|nr:unnamed protein product [Clonostachys byssicola]